MPWGAIHKAAVGLLDKECVDHQASDGDEQDNQTCDSIVKEALTWSAYYPANRTAYFKNQ